MNNLPMYRRDGVIGDRVDGAFVLCDTDSGAFFKTNHVGELVWDLCEGRTIGELILEVCRVYPEERPASVDEAVQKFVRDMMDSGLLCRTT